MSQQQCKVIIKTKNTQKGPNLYETEYLKVLNDELAIFLKNRNLTTTIQKISVAFEGPDYVGVLQVG
jgi:hypothetical protein